MSPKRLLLWPVVSVAGWIDDYPIRAAALLVAVAAIGVVFLPTAVAFETGLTSVTYEGVALPEIVAAATERPAFAAASVIGIVVVIVYDG